ncbi:MAG: hypothetical protein K2L84_06680 [Muribaculaceae bacterium]|nr:hypothetical protein [Muribaculaceae bacterium]
MKYLHYFNPENDIVLGLDAVHYTPSPAVSRFKRAGAILPLWFGNEGDRCLCEGFEEGWFKEMCSAFHLGTDVYIRGEQGFSAAPWGWSKAARKRFELEGFNADVLPDDAMLGKLRELSHRRTASKLNRILAERLPFAIAPAAVELHNEDEIRQMAKEHESLVFKQPWSSSGRGIIPCKGTDIERIMPMLNGIIRRQGSVMAEVRHIPLLDFAMLFNASHGRVKYKGLSLFFNDEGGNYKGNFIASQSVLERKIETFCSAEKLKMLTHILPSVLQEIIGDTYTGPFGVDMMLTDNSYCMAPAIEINLRRTMGHVAMDFFELHAAPDFEGTYAIVPGDSPAGTGAANIVNGKLVDGRINLSAPHSGYSFMVESSWI